MEYTTLKVIHLGSLMISISGFVVRGMLTLEDSPLMRLRVVRILPHLVDTIVLISGIWLMLRIQQTPWEAPWLAAKLIALLAYIGLGMLALRPGITRVQRALALAAALLIFAYIAWVAVLKTPLPWLHG